MLKKVARIHGCGRRAGVLIAALLIISSILGATALMGQTFLGSVVGFVTDRSGGVVPDAKVVLTDTQTAVQRTTVTNSTGNYTFDNLPAGTYTVSVTKTGFRETLSNVLTLGTDNTIRFDAALEVGQVSQTVEVTAKVSALNTQNAQLGAVVTRDQIAELPMEKSPMNFRYLDSANQTGGYLGGQRSNSGFYAVDGISAMSQAWSAWSGPMMSMSMDSIQSITEVTSVPSAQYGDVANVIVTSRSGTSNFHGSAFWDTNNHALDASDWYTHDKAHGPYRQYFGGTFAGPVVIPHLYNGKDRTFFFFQWEEFLQPGSALHHANVPIAAFRNGDFSSLLTLPTPYVIYDPTTWNQSTLKFTRFTNNVIDPSRLSSVSTKLQSYFPSPNLTPPDAQHPWLNNYAITYPNAHPHYYPTVRIDQNLRGGKDMITGRFQYRHQNEDDLFEPLPGFGDIQTRNTTNAYIAETHSFSPSLVNEARLGFSRDYSTYYTDQMGASVAQNVGLQIPGVSGLGGKHGFPGIGLSNFTSLGGWTDNGWAMNTTEFLDDVTWSHGKHLVKAGFVYRHNYVNNPNLPDATQLFGYTGFSAFGTQNTVAGVTGATLDPKSGWDYASFLLGLPNSSKIVTSGPNIDARFHEFAAYVEEEWRVTRKLTLNAGLRWEHTPGPVDQSDMRYAFDPANGDLVVPSQTSLRLINPAWPSTFPIETAAQAGWSTGRSLLSTSQDFGPRLSFAYQLPHNIVVRGGAGLFFSPMVPAVGVAGYTGGPFSITKQFANQMSAPATGSGSTNANFLFTFPNPYSVSGGYSNLPGVGGYNISANKPYLRTPVTQQYNFTVEKQFGANAVVRASYMGHHTIETIYTPDLNSPHICSDAAGTCNWNDEYNDYSALYPRYYSVGYGLNGGSEFGNLFELAFQKRYSKNLTFDVNYTHTLLTEDVAFRTWGSFAGDSDIYGYPSYSWDRRYDRGNDGGLAPNRLVGTAVWALPVGKGQRFGSNLPGVLQKVIGGWETSYVLTMRDGYYTDVGCSGCQDFGYARENYSRLAVNQVGNPNTGSRTTSSWFNASAFAPNTVDGQFGNAPPATIQGPGLFNLDFGIIKNVPIHENLKLEFRALMMNATNHANWALPNTDIASSTVGVISGIDSTGSLGSDSNNSGMRQIMLEMRLEF